ncbi:hypothetical protein L9Z17_07575 [Leptospira noguchii]|nr:hypothetical protein [Leptospira noguchii]
MFIRFLRGLNFFGHTADENQVSNCQVRLDIDCFHLEQKNEINQYHDYLIYHFLKSIFAEEKTRVCIEGDCQNGKGKLQNEEGVIGEGNFKNGKFHGLIKAYNKTTG